MIEHELPFCPQSACDDPGLPRHMRRLHKGSKSNSSQATNNYDNSAVVEDEAVNFSGSNNNTVTIQRVDTEVVETAIDGNVEVVDRAFDFGSDALDFGSDALDFAGGVQSEFIDLAGDALDFVGESDQRNANIINASVAGLQGLTDKVIEGITKNNQSADQTLVETLGKYSSLIFIAGAGIGAYALTRKRSA